jgi:two-component system, response regulator, stage 0 sporulation protein F
MNGSYREIRAPVVNPWWKVEGGRRRGVQPGRLTHPREGAGEMEDTSSVADRDFSGKVERTDPGDELRLQGLLTVVLAEDDDGLRSMLAEALRRDGCRVIEVSDGATLLAGMTRAHFDGISVGEHLLLITDARMPKLDGLGAIRALHARGRRPRFVLMAAVVDAELQAEARQLGAMAILQKPFDLQDLRYVVNQTVRRFALH